MRLWRLSIAMGCVQGYSSGGSFVQCPYMACNLLLYVCRVGVMMLGLFSCSRHSTFSTSVWLAVDARVVDASTHASNDGIQSFHQLVHFPPLLPSSLLHQLDLGN